MYIDRISATKGIIRVDRIRNIKDLQQNYVSFLISEFDQRLLLLYRVINRRTLGVALGIMGLLGIIMITYVCVSWCHSHKRGYSIPPSQTKRQDEDDLLFQTDTHLFYNRFVLTVMFTSQFSLHHKGSSYRENMLNNINPAIVA